MSNIYINEPPTSGKVLLVTSLGDIDVELWAKETPKACRNFIQLCMEGYYDGTIFHRIVRDFCAQGGDPTGTGQGGESIYERPFKDEIHQRLRFNRRGLVAMANSGKDDNGSQFFFTLGPSPELDKKHTIFGKVAGDTIYNMVRFNEIEVEGDRPLFPPKIVKTKILDNPFDDIIPRENIKKAKDKDESDKSQSKKSKAKAVKNFSVLSFGEEAEDDENQLDEAIEKNFKNKSKSLHDAAVDPKMLADPALEVEMVEEEERGRKRKNEGGGGSDGGGKRSKFAEPEGLEEDSEEDSEEERERMERDRDSVRDKLKKKTTKKKREGEEEEEEMESKKKKKEEEEKMDSDDEEKATKKKKLEEMQRETKKLMNELRPKKEKEGKEEKEEEEEEEVELKGDEDEITKFKVERLKYVKRKKEMKSKGSDRQDLTLQLLAKFQNKVKESQERKLSSDVKSERPSSDNEEKDDEDDENDDDESAEDIRLSDSRWFSHELRAENSEPVLAKDANVNPEDMFDITDPRHPLNLRRREDDKNKGRKGDGNGEEKEEVL